MYFKAHKTIYFQLTRINSLLQREQTEEELLDSSCFEYFQNLLSQSNEVHFTPLLNNSYILCTSNASKMRKFHSLIPQFSEESFLESRMELSGLSNNTLLERGAIFLPLYDKLMKICKHWRWFSSQCTRCCKELNSSSPAFAQICFCG